MVIGDKVRMLHSHGEGVVTRLDGDSAMVMLSQGIEIPVQKKHLVVVASLQEAVQVEKAGNQVRLKASEAVPGMLFLTEGLYLAALPAAGSMLDLFLVNQSHYSIFVLVYRMGRPSPQFGSQVLLAPASFQALDGVFPRQESNHFTGLAFQFLKYHPSKGDAVPAGECRLPFAKLPWEKYRQRIPVIEKEGFLLQLDGRQEPADPEKIRQAMLEKTSPEARPLTALVKFREIDLHIEKLSSDFRDLSASGILEIQLKAFESAFDRALAEGLEKLIVIHGVGNGFLRNEVHKRLAGNPAIRHFKDARKERFGYGATEIEF